MKLVEISVLLVHLYQAECYLMPDEHLRTSENGQGSTDSMTETTRSRTPPATKKHIQLKGVPLECGNSKGFVPPISNFYVRLYQEGFPWTATTPENKKVECGGAVVNNHYVLTTATCIDKMSANRSGSAHVKLGGHNSNRNTSCNEENPFCRFHFVLYRIADFIKHPDFHQDPNNKHRLVHNIGLLKTTKKIKFNEFVKPVCLPWDYPVSKDINDRELVVGTTTIWTKKSCAEGIKDILPVTKKFRKIRYCSSYYPKAVNGDSFCLEQSKCLAMGCDGGPATLEENGKHVLIGLYSYFRNSYASYNYTLYTSVAGHLTWILDRICK